MLQNVLNTFHELTKNINFDEKTFEHFPEKILESPKLKPALVALALSGVGIWGVYLFYSKYHAKKQLSEKVALKDDFFLTLGDEKPKEKIEVDLIFLKRLIKILGIVIPSYATKEFEYLFILSILLVVRTYLTVEIAELLGRNAQFLVVKDYSSMLWGILKFTLITIPTSSVNSSIRYISAMLALRMRIRLSNFVNNQYISGTNFYKATHLGLNKIDNADQRVTFDIEKFCSEVADLYQKITKPLLDVVLFTWTLIDVTGWQGVTAMYAYFLLSGLLKRVFMPGLGKLIAKESELEGFYRTAHQRLIANSEEIAFYDGAAREKLLIQDSLQAVFQHASYFRYKKALIDVFDGLLVKYWATIAGYAALSAPFIFNFATVRDKPPEILTREYIRNSQYLNKLSSAVGDLVIVGNKINQLAGYTSRVSELLEKIKKLTTSENKPFDIREDSGEKELIKKEETGGDLTVPLSLTTNKQMRFLPKWKAKCDEIRSKRILMIKDYDFIPPVIGGGTYEITHYIEFSHVDIVSPEGKVLIKDLNVRVKPYENVMVTGPNGSGKSSCFRVLGQLWPLHSGKLKCPHKTEIMFIPQKPYCVLGTLRDQIIYPHTKKQMEDLGVTDNDLANLLELVDPIRLITKTWTFDTQKDWFSAFSGGQKQRVALARLFYHRPKYAVLDECTSAVSEEIEDKIYETCSQLGITMFTISHRRSLEKHHQFILALDGNGGYTFTKNENYKRIQRIPTVENLTLHDSEDEGN